MLLETTDKLKEIKDQATKLRPVVEKDLDDDWTSVEIDEKEIEMIDFGSDEEDENTKLKKEEENSKL